MSISFWPAVQSISGGSSGSPSVITRDSQWTIVHVDTTTDINVQLPSGSDVGDVFEIYFTGPNQASVSPPSGETFIGGNTALLAPQWFRKISSTLWAFL